MNDRLIPASNYRAKFLQELTDRKLLEYFDGLAKDSANTWMMLFDPEDWVPGGAWPGNYGRVHIIDFRTYMHPKGRRRIVLENGDIDYQDCDDQNDLVLQPLNTTAQNIAAGVAYKRTSTYNFPDRIHEKYRGRLLVTIGGTICQGSDLTEEMLAEALAELTPFERSRYEQSLYKIDVSLDPSVEQPIQVRIDGIDDGAEMALFADVLSAHAALEDISWMNSQDCRRRHGFQNTD